MSLLEVVAYPFDAKIGLGENLELSCTIRSSYPAAEISWYRTVGTFILQMADFLQSVV